MEEDKLQLSSQFWTAKSLVDRVDIFQKFLVTDNNIKRERCFNHVKFEVSGASIAIQLIFIDNVEVLPEKFDEAIFKLIFIPKGTSETTIEGIAKKANTFAFLFEEDINLLMTGLRLGELALYKVFYHFIKGNNLQAADYDRGDVHRFHENFLKRKITLADFEFEKVLEKIPIENHPRSSARHLKFSQLLSEIKNENTNNIVLSGKSASGKTTLAYSIAYEITPSFECYFIESTILDDESIAGIAIDLIMHLYESSKPLLLIVDDLQSNLAGAKKIIQFLNYLEKKFSGKRSISFVGIIWDDFSNEIKHTFDNSIIEINISASDLILKLIARCNRKLTKVEAEVLVNFSDNNLFILSLAIKYLNENQEKSIEEILQSIPELVFTSLIAKINEPGVKLELAKLLYCLSLFGQYEIDLTIEFVSRCTNSDANFIESLFEKNVIRRRGNGVTLGHKSYNRIIFEFIKLDESIIEWYKTSKGLSSNADFILEFLKGLQPNQIYSLLKKLYENSKSLSVSNMIIDTWQSIDKILDKILFQQKFDPTWNNTASSSLFAIQTLDSFGFRKEAEMSIRFFRSFYAISDMEQKIDISLANLSTGKDFEKIKECLINQDKLEKLQGERGIELDESEFHKNWLSGVILSAEGFHNSLSDEKLLNLTTYVENQAINGKYFYPERVSWCSSRVLIGLGLCKRNINNSIVVANVADWLLNHPNYNQEKGYWVSGTGSWNHWFEATALAISGLVSVGISPEHKKIQKGIENLLNNKNLFISKGMELDGIFAIQTLSKAGVDMYKVQNEIKTLSKWMTTKADWASVRKTSDETFKQSCQISQSAAGLVEVMWKMVTEDLPTVVKAIDQGNVPLEDITIFVSYEWGSQDFASELVNQLYLKYGKNNVFFDQINNNGISSTFFMEKINDVDIVLYLCTKKYKEKADSRIGGVGNEAEHIAKGSYENQNRFIPILLEGDWNTEFMPNFWKTTIGIKCTEKKLSPLIVKRLHEMIKIKYLQKKLKHE